MNRHALRPTGALLALLLAGGCGGDAGGDASPAEEPADGGSAVLGPVDGQGLPPTDLDRVAVGDTAPDFTLASYAGRPVTLSDFRGAKRVVLVFYRGHW